jgi:hypothetical protein
MQFHFMLGAVSSAELEASRAPRLSCRYLVSVTDTLADFASIRKSGSDSDRFRMRMRECACAAPAVLSGAGNAASPVDAAFSRSAARIAPTGLFRGQIGAACCVKGEKAALPSGKGGIDRSLFVKLLRLFTPGDFT